MRGDADSDYDNDNNNDNDGAGRMKNDRIDIYVFSGTGNTLCVVEAAAEEFRRLGVAAVRVLRLEQSEPLGVDLDAMLGLAFPVAAQSTYPFVWDFLERLPDAKGTPVFMIDTLHAFSGGIVGPLRRLLEGKGYCPVGAVEIRMPSNFFPGRVDDAACRAKVDRGEVLARDFARKLMTGEARWRRLPGVSDAMCWFSRRRFLWALMRRFFALQADGVKCVSCGLCAQLCPVGNIQVGQTAEFGDACQTCMRCVTYCPQGAIFSPRRKYSKKYRAIGEDRLQNAERLNS